MYTQHSPTEDTAVAYEAAFQYFSQALFRPALNIELPPVLLTLSRRRGGRALAFFAPDMWRDRLAGGRLCEIALVPEHTARDPRDVLSSLCHEMAHYADHIQGTAAKTPGYHGKKWFAMMEKIGLPGIANSPAKIAVSHAIREGGPYDLAYRDIPQDILLPFVARIRRDPLPPTKKGRRARYLCGGCSTTMRGPTGRRVLCIDCERTFVETGF